MLYVYDNWSAYDELSDNILLTEELAMRQFDEAKRLRSQGVRIDGYLMDAFWYEPSSAYMKLRPDRWPNGPDNLLAACQREGILPGLWFPANTVFQLEVPESWKDSAASDGWGLCCFDGGFMRGFIQVLTHWYGQGIRLFKFDFADFGAATDATKLKLLPSEIRSKNIQAYRAALQEFKRECPEATLLAYNGFEEAEFMTWTDRPARRVIDPGWLDIFESIYSGDPRPADIPLPNFWRTVDIYSDCMVRTMHAGGLPLERIDDCAFMMGVAGTCYKRGNAGWKTALILSLARGGRVHMTLGNLEQFSNDDAKFIATAQRFFELTGPSTSPLHPISGNDIYSFGSDPINKDAFMGWVNPALETKQVSVEGELVYADGAFKDEVGNLILQPGGVALLGRGTFAEFEFETDPFERFKLVPTKVDWDLQPRQAEAKCSPPLGDLHLVFRQVDGKGMAVRTSGGAPPDGKPMSELLHIKVSQLGREVAVERPDDHVIWSGLSWAYGIVRARDLDRTQPVHIHMSTTDQNVKKLIPQALVATKEPSN